MASNYSEAIDLNIFSNIVSQPSHGNNLISILTDEETNATIYWINFKSPQLLKIVNSIDDILVKYKGNYMQNILHSEETIIVEFLKKLSSNLSKPNFYALSKIDSLSDYFPKILNLERIVQKLHGIAYFRQVKCDNNSFYRSVYLSYFENILLNHKVEPFINEISSKRNLIPICVNVSYIIDTFRIFDTLDTDLDKRVCLYLEAMINTDFDNASIAFFQYKVFHYINQNHSLDSLKEGIDKSVLNKFDLQKNILDPQREFNEIEITAFASSMKINLIVYDVIKNEEMKFLPIKQVENNLEMSFYESSINLIKSMNNHYDILIKDDKEFTNIYVKENEFYLHKICQLNSTLKTKLTRKVNNSSEKDKNPPHFNIMQKENLYPANINKEYDKKLDSVPPKKILSNQSEDSNKIKEEKKNKVQLDSQNEIQKKENELKRNITLNGVKERSDSINITSDLVLIQDSNQIKNGMAHRATDSKNNEDQPKGKMATQERDTLFRQNDSNEFQPPCIEKLNNDKTSSPGLERNSKQTLDNFKVNLSFEESEENSNFKNYQKELPSSSLEKNEQKFENKSLSKELNCDKNTLTKERKNNYLENEKCQIKEESESKEYDHDSCNLIKSRSNSVKYYLKKDEKEKEVEIIEELNHDNDDALEDVKKDFQNINDIKIESDSQYSKMKFSQIIQDDVTNEINKQESDSIKLDDIQITSQINLDSKDPKKEVLSPKFPTPKENVIDNIRQKDRVKENNPIPSAKCKENNIKKDPKTSAPSKSDYCLKNNDKPVKINQMIEMNNVIEKKSFNLPNINNNSSIIKNSDSESEVNKSIKSNSQYTIKAQSNNNHEIESQNINGINCIQGEMLECLPWKSEIKNIKIEYYLSKLKEINKERPTKFLQANKEKLICPLTNMLISYEQIALTFGQNQAKQINEEISSSVICECCYFSEFF